MRQQTRPPLGATSRDPGSAGRGWGLRPCSHRADVAGPDAILGNILLDCRIPSERKGHRDMSHAEALSVPALCSSIPRKMPGTHGGRREGCQRRCSAFLTLSTTWCFPWGDEVKEIRHLGLPTGFSSVLLSP